MCVQEISVNTSQTKETISMWFWERWSGKVKKQTNPDIKIIGKKNQTLMCIIRLLWQFKICTLFMCVYDNYKKSHLYINTTNYKNVVYWGGEKVVVPHHRYNQHNFAIDGNAVT